jgi:hypothetical protein
LKQALPFAAKRVPEEPPRLTLQQHASLTVDIALAPERAMESLGRYGLTVPEKVALDALYRERLAADPAARAAWHEAYRFYHAWLTSRRPGA